MSREQYALSYQVSPIVLIGGVAPPGSQMAITAFTNPEIYSRGPLSQPEPLGLDDFFAVFTPLAGATLIDNQIGQYPFASQSIAANAIVTQPLRVSMLMHIPVRKAGGYQVKKQIMTALQKTLQQHNNLGGTYNVATPAIVYTNCIMTAFRDVTGGETKQVQSVWQMDFVQPLLTLEAAQAAMNLQMSRTSNQLPMSGDPPRATGAGEVSANIGTATVPAVRPLAGANP